MFNKLAVAAAAVLIAGLVGGCSASHETVEASHPGVKEDQERERGESIALQRFIDGSTYDAKGDFARAAIEYLDALRYDKKAAIYYALSKDYAALGKNDLAIDASREAVSREPENTSYRRTLAENYIKAMQFDSAAAQYGAILALDSTDVNSMFSYAHLIQARKPFDALAMYDRILQLTGADWNVLNQIAQLNQALGRFGDAAKALEKMAELDPNNTALLQNLGEMYVRADDYDKAMKVYTDLLAKDSTDVDVRGAVAGLYAQQGDWDRAQKEFETILQSDSLSADARFKIAMAYIAEAEKDSTRDSVLFSSASRQFETFRDQYPDDWRPYFFLGRLKMIGHDDSAAVGLLLKSTGLAPWNAEAWWYLGSLFFDQKEYQSMVDVLERGRRAVPNDPRLAMMLGMAYTRVGRNEDAVVALEESIHLDPKNVDALAILGDTYGSMKRFKDSDSAYEAALKIDPHRAVVLNNFAYGLAERDTDLDRAYTMSLESLQKDSANGSYLDTFGWILFKLGRYTEAETYVLKAVNTGEGNAVVYEHLGDIYAKLNMQEKAKEWWTKALELDGTNVQLKGKLARGSL